MTTRTAIAALELAAACVGLGTVALLIAVGMQDQLALRKLDQQSAQLEELQNTLSILRQHRVPELPQDWTVHIEMTATGSECVTVQTPFATLSTLRAQP